MATRLTPLVLGLALLAGACSISDAAPPDEPPPTTVPDPTPVEPDDPDDLAGQPPLVVDWHGGFTLQLDNGWTVAPCEGDAPLICFSDGERHVGSVEIGAWALPDEFDGETRSYLLTHAERFQEDLAEDRAAGCPDLTFEALPPVDFEVGGTRGVKAGFRMVDADGGEMERHILYWAVHDAEHVVINAGAYDDEGGCVERMGEFTPPDLGIAAPYIDRIVRDTPLPGP